MICKMPCFSFFEKLYILDEKSLPLSFQTNSGLLFNETVDISKNFNDGFMCNNVYNSRSFIKSRKNIVSKNLSAKTLLQPK